MMIKSYEELETTVRENLEKSFSLSEFFLEAVRQIELRLPPAPDDYRFDARYYWQTPGGSGYSGQILRRKGGAWIGEKDGRRYPSIADYISCWWEPFRIARGMVEAYFDHLLNTGVDGVFGRGGADNYRLAKWWVKP